MPVVRETRLDTSVTSEPEQQRQHAKHENRDVSLCLSSALGCFFTLSLGTIFRIVFATLARGPLSVACKSAGDIVLNCILQVELFGTVFRLIFQFAAVILPRNLVGGGTLSSICVCNGPCKGKLSFKEGLFLVRVFFKELAKNPRSNSDGWTNLEQRACKFRQENRKGGDSHLKENKHVSAFCLVIHVNNCPAFTGFLLRDLARSLDIFQLGWLVGGSRSSYGIAPIENRSCGQARLCFQLLGGGQGRPVI